MTIAYLPDNTPASGSDAPCVRDHSTSLTYAELDHRARQMASLLKDRGIRRGDVVAIMLPNSVDFVVGLFGAWLVGATVTPINPTFTAREFDYQVTDSRAKLVLGTAPAETTVTVPVIAQAEVGEEPIDEGDWGAIGRDDIAVIIYTSGSTGRPKGVLLDHSNLDNMARMIAAQNELTPDDHCLLILPLFHVNSICASLLASLTAGGQVTILERFDPDTFIAAVNRYRPTYFSTVPAILARLVEQPTDTHFDTSSLRFVLCGAAPVSVELLTKCEDRFGLAILEGYGLTEATCASAANPITGVRKPGTVGQAFAGQRVIVADDEGKPVPVGQRGEVLIAGPTVMRGYLNNPEETARAIRDGWLHTGDVGDIAADGYLTLVDRIKDMIIRGGENIYPKEIEAMLGTHPSVLESAVVGIPDETYGELPYAQVVLDPNAPSVSSDDLLAHCRTGLTKIKVPVAIEIVEALPRNPVGKIDKPALRTHLARRHRQNQPPHSVRN